jgi:hypothetical protein
MTFLSVPQKTVAITQLKGTRKVLLFFHSDFVRSWELELAIYRLGRMWNEEVKRRGLEDASLKRVTWKFVRSRVLVNIVLYLTSIVFGFIGPV